MAISTLFLTGFEHGFVGSAAAVAGGGLTGGTTTPGSGWTADTSAPRNGSYCARLVSPASTATELKFPVPGNPTKFVMRFGFKAVSGPATNGSRIFTLADSGATVILTVTRAPTGGITFLYGGSAGGAGTTIADTNWHLFEFQIDTAAKTLEWKLDGVARAGFTSTGTPLNVATVSLGTNSVSFPTVTYDYDDLIFGSWTTAASDWYGDGKILAQLAGVDGTHATITSLSPGDAGTAYSGTPTTVNTMVDDPAATGGWTATRSTTDNIALRVATVGAYAEIKPATTAETGSANAVRAIMSYSSSATQANLAACDVRNSANAVTELWGLTGGVGKAYNVTTNNFKGAIVTAPAAGWTAAEVNAIRIRFGGCTSADISPVPTVQAMMLEVDWPISITGTAWDPGTQADAIAITDSIGLVTGRTATIADPVAIADQPMTVGVFNVDTLADTMTITDVPLTVGVFNIDTLADTMGVTDLAAAGLSYAPTLADTVTISDGAAAAIPDPVSIGTASDTANTSTVVLTTTTAVAVGDTILIAFGLRAASTAGRTLNTVTDSAGNTYTIDATKQMSNTVAGYSALARTVATVALPAGGTITATIAGGATALQRSLVAAKVAGVALTVDVAAKTADSVAGGANAAYSAPSVTTTAANRLLWAEAFANVAGSSTPGTGVTELHDFASPTNSTMTTGFRQLSTAGTYSFSGTWDGAYNWTTIAIAYSAPSVPGLQIDMGWDRALTDLLAATDTPAYAAVIARSLADPAAITDTLAKDTGLTIPDLAAITDSAVTDLQVGGTALTQPLADTATITDAAASLAILTAAIADLAGITDTPALAEGYDRTLTDTAAITDLLASVGAYVRQVDDTASLTDLLASTTILARTLADTAGITDAATSLAIYTALLADTAGITDTPSSVAAFQRLIADSAAITDLAGLDRGLSFADPAGLTDTTAALTILQRLLADTGTLTDAPSIQATGALSSTINDTAAITDTLALQAAFQRLIADPAGITDLTDLGIGRNPLLTDAAGVTDQLVSSAAYTTLLNDLAGITDTPAIQAAGVLAQTVNDTAGLIDAWAFQAAVQQAIADTAGITDIAGLGVGVAFTIPDLAVVTDLRDVSWGTLRTLADTASITDLLTSTAATDHARTLTEFLTITDLLAYRADRALTLPETLAVTDLLTRTHNAQRVFADLLSITDLALAQRFTSILMRLRVSDRALTHALLTNTLLTRLLLADLAYVNLTASARAVARTRTDHRALTRIRTG